jgi:hyperosmotically inducible protein
MKMLNVLALLAAVFALTACDKSRDGATVGQKVDEAVASAKTAAAEVKETAKKGVDDAATVSKEKSEQVAHSVNDIAITAAIKADLAKDRDLSALRINVDTKDGHVSLYGSAPNAAAKERATAIASAEKGVSGVENKLAIETR